MTKSQNDAEALLFYKAREIICAFLKELNPQLAGLEHQPKVKEDAARLIGRLSHAGLFLCTEDQIKE